MSNELQVTENQVVTKAKKGFLLVAGTQGQVSTILKTPEGYLRCVPMRLTLHERMGHFYCADAGDNKRPANFQITAEGFKFLAKHAGVEEIQNTEVRIGPHVYPNPFFELDSQGKKSKVYAKSTVIGRDMKGDYVTATATIMFDAKDSLVTDLINKVTWVNNTGEILMNDEVAEFRKTNKGYAVYPIDEWTSVVVNLKHKEIRQVLKNYQTNKEMMDRKLVTMAFRNACKKHPAIAQSRVDPIVDSNGNLIAYVNIVKWLDDIDAEKENAINEYMASDKAQLEFEMYNTQDDETMNEIPDEQLEEVLSNIPEEPPTVEQKNFRPQSENDILLEWILNSPLDRQEIDQICSEISDTPLEEMKAAQLKIVKKTINTKIGG